MDKRSKTTPKEKSSLRENIRPIETVDKSRTSRLFSWFKNDGFKFNDLKIKYKLMTGFLLIIVMLVTMGVMVLVNTLKMKKQFTDLVDHDAPVISNAILLEKFVVDMETGQRGFLLTGEDGFLEPYTKGEKEFKKLLIIEKNLVDHNLSQLELLREIEVLVNTWKEKAALPEIALAKKIFTSGKSLDTLNQLLGKGEGKALMDKFRSNIDKLETRFESSQNLRGIILTGKILTDMVDMETGQRGFLITGDKEFLEPYEKGAGDFAEHITELYKEVLYDRTNKELVDNLVALSEDWKVKAAIPEIEARKSINDTPEKLQDLSTLLKAKTGKNILDEIRGLFKNFIEVEQGLTTKRIKSANAATQKTIILIYFIVILAPLISIAIGTGLSNLLSKSIGQLQEAAVNISEGNLDYNINIHSKDEIGELAGHMEVMRNNILMANEKNREQNWRLTGSNIISEQVKGIKEVDELAQDIINSITPYLNSQMGSIYLQQTNGEEKTFKLTATYAYDKRNQNQNTVNVGEGLVGQAALEKKSIIYTDVPEDYFKINSALGKVLPKNIMVLPILYEGDVTGVMEFGTTFQFSELQLEFVNSLSDSIGIAINSARSRTELALIYKETKKQAEILEKQQKELLEINEELHTQQEELKQANVDLEEKSQKLLSSEEELRAQQEELTQSNQELEEKTNALEEKNSDIELAQKDLLRKAHELVVTNNYKSEFLANMSHELRTPLNSILLLSQLLYENHDKNLSEDQLKYSNIIHTSGSNLLSLIDEILDLAKIESGKMNVNIEKVSVNGILNNMDALFKPVANKKGLRWSTHLEDDVPESIQTDTMRVEQIIKNLLSNSFKFTKKGEVELRIFTPPADIKFGKETLIPGEVIGFSVKDSGIGIPKDKQLAIFEAFQQADGSTQREYGGTGLGLSISREIAYSFGGEIQLESVEGKGSTFTLYLPKHSVDSSIKEQENQNHKKNIYSLLKNKNDEASENDEPGIDTGENELKEKHISKGVSKTSYLVDKIPDEIADDRDSIKTNDKSILIIEDDTALAEALLKRVNEHHYKGVVAVSGDKGVEYAKKFLPTAILLDLILPVKDGWTVMEELKSDPKTKAIPVHMMSSLEVQKESIERGAIDYIKKTELFENMERVFDVIKTYTDRTDKNVLIIDENKKHQDAMKEYIGAKGVHVVCASTAKEGMRILKTEVIDCVVLDMEIPDVTGYDLLENIKTDKECEKLPVIIYTGKSLSEQEERKIMKYASTIIVKTADSYERLTDEVSLFLHLVEKGNHSKKEKKTKPYFSNDALNGKTVLMVDDDVKNMFLLTKTLENMKMKVHPAYNGKEALEVLENNDGIDVILMDIMMPEMDGYEAISKIRKKRKFKNIPIIAVTAKAMLGDRAKCIKAGASDYISKPVDIHKLMSLLRVWLYN